MLKALNFNLDRTHANLVDVKVVRFAVWLLAVLDQTV